MCKDVYTYSSLILHACLLKFYCDIVIFKSRFFFKFEFNLKQTYTCIASTPTAVKCLRGGRKKFKWTVKKDPIMLCEK